MPARVGAWPAGGVTTIEGLGRFIPPEWFRRFKKAGWDWHPVPRHFTKKGLTPQIQAEAEALTQQYNNRFEQAA